MAADLDPTSLPGGLRTVLDWASQLHGDAPGAELWTALDNPLRLALAQAWILNTGGYPDDRRAAALSRREIIDQDARDMLEGYIARWQQVYSMLANEFGAWAAPTLVGVDMELVVLVDREHVGYVQAGTAVPGHSFVVRLREQDWVIAALARRLPVPGWPPTEREVPGLGIEL